MKREPEAIQVIQMAFDWSRRTSYMGSDYSEPVEHKLAQVYRENLSAEEVVRWRETWLDMIGCGEHEWLGIVLALARDRVAADTILGWIKEGRLDDEVAVRIVSAYLHLSYRDAIPVAYAVLDRPQVRQGLIGCQNLIDELFELKSPLPTRVCETRFPASPLLTLGRSKRSCSSWFCSTCQGPVLLN